VPAPILYASTNQINTVAPFEIGVNPTTRVTLLKDDAQFASLNVDVAPFSVGLFTQSATGVGQVLGANEDGTLNGGLNPAPPGSVITVYLTGGGQTNPAGITGGVSAEAGNLLVSTTAVVDGHPADVTYAGPAPGSVAGLIQVNLRVPPAATASFAASLTVAIG